MSTMMTDEDDVKHWLAIRKELRPDRSRDR